MKKLMILVLSLGLFACIPVFSNLPLPHGSYIESEDASCHSCSISTVNNNTVLKCYCADNSGNLSVANPITLAPCSSDPHDLSCYNCDNNDAHLNCRRVR